MNFEQQIDDASQALSSTSTPVYKEPWFHGIITFVVVYGIFLLAKPSFLKKKKDDTKIDYGKGILWSVIIAVIVFGLSFWYKSKYCSTCAA